MIVNGIDLDGLCEDVEVVHYPNTVPGRVVHIDGDFLAYQVSAEKKDEEGTKSFADMQHNCEVAVDHLRSLAGAERAKIYLTPKGSDKGGRYEIATLREYQATRQNKDKPKYLHEMRDWMSSKLGALGCMHSEADDAMAEAQYEMQSAGHWDRTIVASRDKDLRMVPGLQLNWADGLIEGTEQGDDYGRVWMEVTEKKHPETGKATKTKKPKGYGWSFFWLQMLMGDTADNINGLPLVHPAVMNKIKPTAASKKDPSKRAPGKCGAVMAMDIMDTVKDNKAAFKVVQALYKAHPEPFLHWETGEVVSPGKVFLSEAQLLWMRRSRKDRFDVLKWIQETCI